MRRVWQLRVSTTAKVRMLGSRSELAGQCRCWGDHTWWDVRGDPFPLPPASPPEASLLAVM